MSSAVHHLMNRTALSTMGRRTWTMVEMPEPQSSIDHENQLAMGVCPKTRSRGCTHRRISLASLQGLCRLFGHPGKSLAEP